MLEFLYNNKEYGAYKLRIEYKNNLKKGLLFVIGVCLIFSFMCFRIVDSEVKVNPIVLSDVNLSKIEMRDEVKKETKIMNKKVNTTKYTTITVVPDKEVKDTIVEVDNITTISKVSNNKYNVDDIIDVVDDTVSYTKDTPRIENKKVDDIVEVDENAVFDGDWKRFLERNLRSDIPVENGAPVGVYSVILVFLVDIDGNISDIKIVKDSGYGTLEESIRVIRLSKWRPAKIAGKNVQTYHTQKITFEVLEN